MPLADVLDVIRLSSIKPFEGSRTHVFRQYDGEQVTVAVAPANQWQGWRWLEALSARFEPAVASDQTGLMSVAILVLASPAVVPVAFRWFARILGIRRGWVVTLRPGEHSGSKVKVNARQVTFSETKEDAVSEARELVFSLMRSN